jgi:uncharacterized OB-fold protein
MTRSRPQLPAPVPTPLTAGFWKAAAEGRLVIQRCDECGAHRFAPTAACYRCQSLAWSWDAVAGRGRVFSYTWSHHPVHPALAPLGVYNVAVIELDGTEGDPVRLVSWVEGVTPETLSIGLAVEVGFERIDEEIGLPIFKPRA